MTMPRCLRITAPDTILRDAFDYYMAWRQHRNRDNNYLADVCITYDDRPGGDISILALHYPTCLPESARDYDLIFLDNGGEPLECCTPEMAQILATTPNAYLMCGAYLAPDHALYDRVIPYNHNWQQFSDVMTRQFYPNFYDWQQWKSLDRDPGMWFINGQNRANRHWFRLGLPPAMSQHNAVNTGVSKLLDCQFESDEDRAFRGWVNQLCAAEDQDSPVDYGSTSVKVGIDGKFGRVPRGHFLMQQYFTHHCVIYAETSWINGELFVSEKTWKCLLSGAIPWPVGGQLFNSMMNQHGISTAWNLLPADLQAFDQVADHRERYAMQQQAIAWCLANPHIWQTAQAQHLREQNHQVLWQAWRWTQRMNTMLDRLVL